MQDLHRKSISQVDYLVWKKSVNKEWTFISGFYIFDIWGAQREKTDQWIFSWSVLLQNYKKACNFPRFRGKVSQWSCELSI
jgi:hypothetical protein